MDVYKFGVFINYENFATYADTPIAGADYKIKFHAVNGRPADYENLKSSDQNELSPIITLEYAQSVFVITGDAGHISGAGLPATELLFYNSASANEIFGDGRADHLTTYLQVGHHGSANSTAEYFLDFVTPTYAFVPVGTRYAALPNKNVMTRLESRCVAVYTAHNDGNFVVQIAHAKTQHYNGNDNPPNITFVWIVLILFTLLISFTHNILWSKTC
jgi:beta-lactamase superfamily II metal-dependent hydrolase